MEAATRPVAPPDGTGAYEAPTAEGPLRMALETVSGQAPVCAAEAAVRLSQAEPLLGALETWLTEAGLAAPEWAWRAGPASLPPGAAWARWAGVGVGVRLGLPWALLRRLPPPPPAVALQWSAVTAEWVLATLMLGEAERAALEPGGALLLPASFQPEWWARLRAADEPAPGGLLVVLDPPGGAARLCLAVDDTAALCANPPLEGERWEVRAPLAAPLTPELLLGWRDEPLPLNLDQALSLWRVVPGSAPACWSRGRLLPWGEGHALALDAVAGAAGA
jgi:hypothetical protein